MFKRNFAPRRWYLVFAFLLVPLRTSATHRQGDVVSMTYKTSQVTGRAEESQDISWEEVLRSQKPRFGRPDTVRFKPSLPAGGASRSPAAEDELAVTFAFSEEQLFLRRVKLREGGGGKEGGGGGGPRLSRLVISFTCSAGDIVRVRSDPVYGGGSGVAAGTEGFEVEYRWDRLPEEDEQAGVWLVFAVSLLLTIFLAVDTCNSTGDGHNGNAWDDHGHVGGPPPPPSSPSSSPSSLARAGGRRGRHGEDWARAGAVGGGDGSLRAGGGEESRRRR